MAGHRHGFLRAAGCSATALSVVFFTSLSMGKTDVPVFLFSGQSNMVCIGSAVSDLTADQKKKVDNIKIDSRADQNTKTWSTLGPGFGADANHFGPELFFGKTLSDSMPGKKIAFIKDAMSGTYLGQTGGWLPPSSPNGPGKLYKEMMTHIDKAMASFTTAFDTAQYTPRWAGFIWLQGEFDGWNDESLAKKYEEHLTNLIKDIRTKTGVNDLPVILEMIVATTNMWKYSAIIRAADVAMTTKFDNCDTMDTKGFALSSDGIHYNAASQIKIGTISALRWLNMHFKYSPTVPIAYHYSEPLSAQFRPQPMSIVNLFDLSGRKLRATSGGFERTLKGTLAHNCFFIATISQPGQPPRSEKVTSVGKEIRR